MKKILLLCMVVFSTSMLFAQQETKVRAEVITGTVKPNESEQRMMKIEEDKNPLIAHAITEMQAVCDQLGKASNGYGGNKDQALLDTRAAVISLRKALYFRITVDEHAH
jgi:hypothetical protein